MSEWKEDANKRRDWRHTFWPDEWRTPKPRKDRKRWCKGQEGREHDYRLISDRTFTFVKDDGFLFLAHQTVSKCSKCGRKEYTYETHEVPK